MTTEVRWWMLVGVTSRILEPGCFVEPTTARPPACSTIIAIGFASYISRSLPSGFLRVGGYKKHAALEQDAVHVGHH